MHDLAPHRQKIANDGFVVFESIFSENEILRILNKINTIDQSDLSYRKTDDLYAIRRFLENIPELNELIFLPALKKLINGLFAEEYFLVKSIYFDKPKMSNWFVAWHQDLTISVNCKKQIPGYGPWTVKQNQFAVQPPTEILGDNFTLRVHLDDTNEDNGALRVIPGSHKAEILRTNEINWDKAEETICCVNKGGVMIMRPLLMHASNRTSNYKQRRVIHLEFSRTQLPEQLSWAEKQSI